MLRSLSAKLAFTALAAVAAVLLSLVTDHILFRYTNVPPFGAMFGDYCILTHIAAS